MGLLDYFSGSPGRKAAMTQYAGQQNALNQAQGQLGQGKVDLQNAFAQGQGQLAQIPGVYAPWTGVGGQANQAQADFLGLGNTQAANDALARFRGSTGYNDLVQQSIDAATRSGNALGTGTGNIVAGGANIGGRLADQSAQGYLTNLGNLSSRGLTAAGEVGKGLTSSADLYGREGLGLGALAGTGAGISANLGNQMAQTQGQGMMAGQEAAGRSISALMQLGQMAASALGGGGGGGGGSGGLGSTLGSFFGGGGSSGGGTGGSMIPFAGTGNSTFMF